MRDAKDYTSNRQVKYCAGCGDYAILAALKKTFAELDLEPKNVAVISGIGCSSRTPYYLSTWGFNTIHGRAGAVATGLKLVRPELSVWQCTGDGDCMAIGGNHFIHELRRNVDINIILFNNQIYGLTKGQYSPTTPQGQVTKTSPLGTIERPFNVGELVLGAKGTFYARTLDKELKLTQELMKECYYHHGTAVLECLVNCVVWNDGAHKSREYIVVHDGDELEINGEKIVYDSMSKDLVYKALSYFDGIEHPMLLGVIYREKQPTYEDELYKQMQ